MMLLLLQTCIVLRLPLRNSLFLLVAELKLSFIEKYIKKVSKNYVLYHNNFGQKPLKMYTVKSEFVAAATITSDDFLVRLLIKGGCYLRAATIPTIPI